MISNCRLWASIFLSVAFIQSCSGNDNKKEPAVLPKIFEPISWSTKKKDLPVVLDTNNITSTTFQNAEGKMLTAYIVTDVQINFLGKSTITVTYDKKDKPLSIELMKTQDINGCVNQFDDRKKCYQLEQKKLNSLLSVIKSELEMNLNKAEIYTASYRESMGLPAHKDEKGYLWKEYGYKLFLTLTLDEGDAWSVSVHAVRHSGIE